MKKPKKKSSIWNWLVPPVALYKHLKYGKEKREYENFKDIQHLNKKQIKLLEKYHKDATKQEKKEIERLIKHPGQFKKGEILTKTQKGLVHKLQSEFKKNLKYEAPEKQKLFKQSKGVLSNILSEKANMKEAYKQPGYKAAEKYQREFIQGKHKPSFTKENKYFKQAQGKIGNIISGKEAPEYTKNQPLYKAAEKNYLDYLSGNQKPEFTKENELYKAGHGSLLDMIRGEDKEARERLQRPYLRQFEREVLPGIANRFAGMGATSSSGFQGAALNAGRDLQENLAQMFENRRSNAINQGLGYAQVPYQEQSSYLNQRLNAGAQAGTLAQVPHQERQNVLNQLLGAAGQGAGMAQIPYGEESQYQAQRLGAAPQAMHYAQIPFQQRSSIANQLLGAAGQGAGMAYFPQQARQSYLQGVGHGAMTPEFQNMWLPTPRANFPTVPIPQLQPPPGRGPGFGEQFGNAFAQSAGKVLPGAIAGAATGNPGAGAATGNPGAGAIGGNIGTS